MDNETEKLDACMPAASGAGAASSRRAGGAARAGRGARIGALRAPLALPRRRATLLGRAAAAEGPVRVLLGGDAPLICGCAAFRVGSTDSAS